LNALDLFRLLEFLKDALVQFGGDAHTGILHLHRPAPLVHAAQAVQLGVTGVPALVIGNRYLLVGARPPEALAGAIEKALEKI
jgi:hypothetical protein